MRNQTRNITAMIALLAVTCAGSAQTNQLPANDQGHGKDTAQQVAHVTHAKSEPAYFVADLGSSAFHLGDSVVLVNRTEYGPILTAKGTVDGVSENESAGKLTGIWTNIFADVQSSEIYVVSRADSPCSLTLADFGASHRQAAMLSGNQAYGFVRDDKTGIPIGGTVLNINGSVDVINVGRASCRVGDMAVVVRFTEAGPLLLGTVKIVDVYKTDAVTFDVKNWGGIMPDDAVYVISRANSDISLAKVSFRVLKQ